MITPRLAEPALDALRRATFDGTSLRLPPGRLPRYAFRQITAALVLVAGGGTWRPDTGTFVFPRDPRPELAAFLFLRAAGELACGPVSVVAGVGNPNVHCEVHDG